jgi:hypothetical protein
MPLSVNKENFMSTSSMPQVPSWAPRVIVVVLALLLLFGIGTAIHNAGWSQGYTLGLLTGSAGGGDALTPYLVYRTGGGFHPFGFLGGIFRFLFLFFVVGLLLKFFACGRWRMHGEHPSRWHHHHYGPYGPQNAPQPGEQPGQVTPPADTPPAPAGAQPTVWTHV